MLVPSRHGSSYNQPVQGRVHRVVGQQKQKSSWVVGCWGRPPRLSVTSSVRYNMGRVDARTCTGAIPSELDAEPCAPERGQLGTEWAGLRPGQAGRDCVGRGTARRLGQDRGLARRLPARGCRAGDCLCILGGFSLAVEALPIVIPDGSGGKGRAGGGGGREAMAGRRSGVQAEGQG